jgi:hypothetical protein
MYSSVMKCLDLEVEWVFCLKQFVSFQNWITWQKNEPSSYGCVWIILSVFGKDINDPNDAKCQKISN